MGGVPCTTLAVGSGRTMITKAIIPVAGLGTRLRPITSAIPKAMLPLVDGRGRVRTVLHCILAEATAAGVLAAGLVVSPGQERLVEHYLAVARELGADDLPCRIEYISQPKARGFGDAVLRADKFVAREDAFMLMLGDHVYIAEPGGLACAAQVAAASDRFGGAAMVGMQEVGPQELSRVGVARGEPIGEGVYTCTDFLEKPGLATARRRLSTPGLGDDRFLAHCGVYVFSQAIFDCLKALKSHGSRGGELELAAAQAMLLERHPRDYRLLRIAGRAYDVGTPAGYADAFKRFSVV